MDIIGANLRLLESGVSAGLLRQRIAAQNLANVSTPGYQAKRVVFESQLQQALNGTGLTGMSTNPQHLPIGRTDIANVQPTVVSDSARLGLDGSNNVDIEAESAGMAANEIWVSAMARLLSDELHRLHTVATEGRR